MLLAVLALSGFFWALAMRHNTKDFQHNHEGLFYVGVPLVFYSLLLLCVHKRWGSRPVAGVAVAALLAFVVSAFQVEQRWRPDAGAAELQQAALAELGAIRETVRGKTVLVLGSVEPEWSGDVVHPYYRWRFHLAGSVLTYSPDMEGAVRAADFVVTPDRVESGALLTPGNERVFLYDSSGMEDLVELYRAAYQRAVSGDPVARAYFDVYLGGDAVTYVRDPCVLEDVVGSRTREDAVRTWTFLRMVPEDLQDLPAWRRRYGSNQLRRLIDLERGVADPSWRLRYGSNEVVLRFDNRLALFEGKCMAVLALPDYPVLGIRTGQESRRHRGWEVAIPAGR